MDEFEALILEARIGSSWLTEQLDTLRRNIKRNEFARYWYKSFLQADNDVVSWGALHLMKKCADERFFTWRENFETEIDSKQRRRLSYLESDFELRRDLDRQKERRKHLFGIKVERVDVFPFVRN